MIALAYSDDHLELKCPKENTEAVAFWKARGFRTTGQESSNGDYTVIDMERDI
ncbi:MAG: hypothetical protein IKE43_03450 [Coriobacteriales bacterium]|nr:hypothetical protein [Coriobacteriales bacterium]